MSKEHGFETKGYETRGFDKNIDFDRNADTVKSKSNSETCGGVLAFISTIQEISVQEQNLEEGLDKNLFTIQKSICSWWNGFKLGITTMLTVLLYVLLEFVFSFNQVTSYINNNFIIEFLKYIPVFLTVGVTLYITSINRFAVGSYTNKAIKIFFAGKFVSSLLAGVFLIYFMNLGQSFALESTNYILLNAGRVFESNSSNIYWITTSLVMVSAITPVIFYGLRKFFFNADRTEEYEKY